jgi:hypothetical protein
LRFSYSQQVCNSRKISTNNSRISFLLICQAAIQTNQCRKSKSMSCWYPQRCLRKLKKSLELRLSMKNHVIKARLLEIKRKQCFTVKLILWTHRKNQDYSYMMLMRKKVFVVILRNLNKSRRNLTKNNNCSFQSFSDT